MGRKDSAFTLVELIVVITLIAVLVVIIITYLRSQLFKGNDARRKGDITRIKVAVEEYEKDHNCYPKNIYVNNQCVTDDKIKPYLKELPCDPVTRKPYAYEVDSTSACPDWYRFYTLLQNTADTSVIPGIGPGGSYNFYLGSANAPSVSSSGSQSGTSLYACQGGHLVLITWDPSKCSQTFPSMAFESSCGTPENPQNDCYP